MSRSRLTDLANNPNLIPGIYNYCDRWCERCPLTSRCLVYATEQDDDVQPESQDTRNADFWRTLNSILAETRQMIAEWANQTGIDLNESDEPATRRQRKRQFVDNHPLSKAGKKYASAASEWFRELDQTINTDTAHGLDDAREVIQWYQYQIAVKTIRALSSRTQELEADDPKDSDGSAKVALIGIDRSIAGWRMMQLSLPTQAESIVPLILQLELLRNRVEKHFPQARTFIRPGFDETSDTRDVTTPSTNPHPTA